MLTRLIICFAAISLWHQAESGAAIFSPAGGSSDVGASCNSEYSIEVNSFGSDYFINLIDLTLPNEPNVNRDTFLGLNGIDGPETTQNYLLDGGGLSSRK